MYKRSILILSIFFLTACSSSLVTTVKSKEHIEPYTEHIECNHCSYDGFIEIKKPSCWQLVIEQLGEEEKMCVPKKVWDRTTVGEEWHSQSLLEKSQG